MEGESILLVNPVQRGKVIEVDNERIVGTIETDDGKRFWVNLVTFKWVTLGASIKFRLLTKNNWALAIKQ